MLSNSFAFDLCILANLVFDGPNLAFLHSHKGLAILISLESCTSCCCVRTRYDIGCFPAIGRSPSRACLPCFVSASPRRDRYESIYTTSRFFPPCAALFCLRAGSFAAMWETRMEQRPRRATKVPQRRKILE